MTSSQPPLDPSAPFKYVGGDPSLDLVDTVDWTGRGLEVDRLTSYERLLEWAEGAGVVSPQNGRALRRLARLHRRQADRALSSAHQLRGILQRVFAGIAAGKPDDDALAELNERIAPALAHLRVTLHGARPGWTWLGADEALESVLWPVTWSAAQLLAGRDADLIRRCAGDNCGWMFVDRSRNGLRRWCEMSTCGTREKSRRRAARPGPGA